VCGILAVARQARERNDERDERTGGRRERRRCAEQGAEDNKKPQNFNSAGYLIDKAQVTAAPKLAPSGGYTFFSDEQHPPLQARHKLRYVSLR